MGRVLARERQVLIGDGPRRGGRRHACGAVNGKRGRSIEVRPEELTGERPAKQLRQEGRSGVAGLADLLTVAAGKLPGAWKAL